MKSLVEDNRSEYIGIYVTPEFKKHLDLVKDNTSLRDTLINQFFEGEKEWMEQEIKGIDEQTIKYRAKLLQIKDNFSQAQQSYVEEIDKIYESGNKTLKDLDKRVSDIQQQISFAKEQLGGLSKSIISIHTGGLEKLLDLVDRYNKMGDDEKTLIMALINKQ